MALKRSLAIAVSLSFLWSGCSSPSASGGGGDGGTSHDGSTSHMDAALDSGQGCTPDKPLVSIPYAPPTPFDQGLCTGTQTDDYVKDFKANNTQAFRADLANASCLTCIETLETAAMHGPVIVEDTGGGGVEVVQTNYGGCVANFIGDTTTTGCGEMLDAYNNCALQECGGCADYTEDGKHVQACLTAAVSSGPPPGECHDVWNSKVAACQNDLSSGPSMICGSLNDFLYKWCGGHMHQDAGSSTDGASTD
jgi:hypothetical protein